MDWASSGARQADPAERGGMEMSRGTRDALRNLFQARYARLQAMRNEWSAQLPPSDWRIRLLHKALYSTWADLRDLQETRVG